MRLKSTQNVTQQVVADENAPKLLHITTPEGREVYINICHLARCEIIKGANRMRLTTTNAIVDLDLVNTPENFKPNLLKLFQYYLTLDGFVHSALPCIDKAQEDYISTRTIEAISFGVQSTYLHTTDGEVTYSINKETLKPLVLQHFNIDTTLEVISFKTLKKGRL